jgi:acyl carrier protein
MTDVVKTETLLQELLTQALDPVPTNITLDLPLQELGIDSLELIELIFQIEDTIGIKISDEAVKELKTVGDVIVLVDRARVEQLPESEKKALV